MKQNKLIFYFCSNYMIYHTIVYIYYTIVYIYIYIYKYIVYNMNLYSTICICSIIIIYTLRLLCEYIYKFNNI